MLGSQLQLLAVRAARAAGASGSRPCTRVPSRATQSTAPGKKAGKSSVTLLPAARPLLRSVATHVARSRPVALPSNEILDLTEDNVKAALLDAREELLQLFDLSAGMTGKAELAELDGPVVRLRLSGRFWHQRSLVVLRVGAYLQQRIPEILEVEIEDEKQLDDSPANF